MAETHTQWQTHMHTCIHYSCTRWHGAAKHQLNGADDASEGTCNVGRYLHTLAQLPAAADYLNMHRTLMQQ